MFADEVIRQIYTAQSERNSANLIKFFKNENALYREYAALAFGSVQDSLVLPQLISLLDDENENVRKAAAYAIGQTRIMSIENQLIAAIENEGSFAVQSTLLEALGKCGTEKALEFVCKINYPENNLIQINGQLWALNRFAIRKMHSAAATQKALQFLYQTFPEEIRYLASIYFARTKADLKDVENQIIECAKNETDVFAKMNLVLALGKIKTQNSFALIAEITRSNSDYRLSVNALEALSDFEYAQAGTIAFEMLEHKNVNVKIKAAEYFQKRGTKPDAYLYFQRAKEADNWRVKCILLETAMKLADDKTEYSTFTEEEYKVAENQYEKANLLYALGSNPLKHSFIADEIKKASSKIVATRGFEALVNIRMDSIFEHLKMRDPKLEATFAQYFKEAIESKDMALVGMAATVLRDTSLKYNEYYKNVYFLKQALADCQFPKEIETYIELQKTVNFFFGTNDALPEMKSKSIDWALAQTISTEQKVVIQTLKGNIILKLNINEAPESVTNFIRLIKDKYFDNKIIHRVVPNFVAQDGCNRGDGWGSENYTIRSEFAPLYYGEGSVGMASAGKDTESTQWFITHSPTPHLDGRYTIFGEVISGMETVHQLEVGDEILGFEILE